MNIVTYVYKVASYSEDDGGSRRQTGAIPGGCSG
jgi:hypothetical protein